MAICKIGNNTRETVIQNFQVNNLISAQQSDGVFLVLKPVDFDAASDELGEQLAQNNGLIGSFWSRTGGVARFNNTLAVLADVLGKRAKDGNSDFTNNYSPPPISPTVIKPVRNKGTFNIQTVDNYATEIIRETAVFDRFSQGEQRGLAEGGTIHAATSIILGTGPGTNTTSSASNEEQEGLVETYAKAKGVWIDNVNSEYGRADASGEEALVWIIGKDVRKSQNTFQYGNLQEKLDGITLHNTLFPETALTVTGFGRDKEGVFQVIVTQPFVIGNSARKVTVEDIEATMLETGFTRTEDNNYGNSETLVEDLHTGNAILTADGRVAIIDPIVRLNTPDAGYGGTRILTKTTDTLNKIREARYHGAENLKKAEMIGTALLKKALSAGTYFSRILQSAVDKYTFVAIHSESHYDGDRASYVYLPKPNSNTQVQANFREWDTDRKKPEPKIYDATLVNSKGDLIDNNFKPFQDKDLSIRSGTFDEDHLYRGISKAELVNAVQRGYLKSDARSNLGGQENTTSFAQNPGQATNYASGFNGWNDAVTFNEPKYVIKIAKDWVEFKPTSVTEPRGEVDVSGSIPISKILEIHEIRLTSATEGSIEIVEENGKIREGSRSGMYQEMAVRKMGLGELVSIEQNPLTGKPDENNSIATAELPSIQVPEAYRSPC